VFWGAFVQHETLERILRDHLPCTNCRHRAGTPIVR
jgi:hypothetical protein